MQDQLTKRQRQQALRTMNLLCGLISEYTPPEVKYSERNHEIAKILMALDKLKKL